ncbi:hypothetical protein [Nostoc commune]|uniref:hypothetical protein n=1 Tax=Nostoc commune TaxID=1178 RepID=UPI0018C5B193|nr:hypothetical protein [Nostoc commune]
MSPIKFKPHKKVAYNKIPLQLKVAPGVREKVMAIPDWQELVRQLLDKLIIENQKPT